MDYPLKPDTLARQTGQGRSHFASSVFAGMITFGVFAWAGGIGMFYYGKHLASPATATTAAFEDSGLEGFVLRDNAGRETLYYRKPGDAGGQEEFAAAPIATVDGIAQAVSRADGTRFVRDGSVYRVVKYVKK